MPRSWLGLVVSVGAAALGPGCLVDLDQRCGEHQRFDAETEVCLCESDYARQGDSCVACGEHETGSADGCVCVEGFSRVNADSPCVEAAALGQPCTGDDACSDEYSHCAIAAGDDEGYCTLSDCSTAEDCPTDYGCNTRGAPSFCERPPEGLGTPCASAGDCEGFAASYCETVSAGACLVNECASDPNKCHGDWVCCGIGLLSQSLCIPPSELEDGSCPAGGTIIPRTE